MFAAHAAKFSLPALQSTEKWLLQSAHIFSLNATFKRNPAALVSAGKHAFLVPNHSLQDYQLTELFYHKATANEPWKEIESFSFHILIAKMWGFCSVCCVLRPYCLLHASLVAGNRAFDFPKPQVPIHALRSAWLLWLALTKSFIVELCGTILSIATTCMHVINVVRNV